MGNIIELEQSCVGIENRQSNFRNVQEVLLRLKPEYPVYLFNREQLIRRSSIFQLGFKGRVAYAVKANSRMRVLRTLIGQGIRDFDVASIAEIRRLKSIDPQLQLHFNNPIKPLSAIVAAWREFGVRSFALDDHSELEKIISACDRPEELLLSVRFNLPRHRAAYDFGAKFGATPNQAVKLLSEIRALGAQAALTFHPGSQCTDYNEYSRYIRVSADIAARANVDLAQINVGGGFPEYYGNTVAQPHSEYFSVIQKSLDNAFCGKPPPIMCEPGRSMVASCTSLLVQVIHVREASRTVFINDGVYGGLQEQNLVDFRLPLRIWRAAKRVETERVPYTIFGPTCDPSDRLPRTLELPSTVQTGDYLQFGLMGAYGSETATRFNGFDSQRYVNVMQ